MQYNSGYETFSSPHFPRIVSLMANPNPNINTTSNLNADATPYMKLTPYSPPLPPLFVVSHPSEYIYHHHYPLQILYYYTNNTQVFREQTQFYTVKQQPLAPKKLQTYFPRYEVVEKDFGVEKSKTNRRSGSSFYAPRLGSRRSYFLGCKVEKEKSRVTKKSLHKKVLTDHVGFSGGNIVTSLMIRNIPNKFQRNDLMKILDNYCLEQNKVAKLQRDPWKSRYDFLYLPMDFKTGGNLGYAFVNFTTPIAASRFRDAFQQHKWEVPNNKKICEVSNAVIQGRDALRNHFRNSVFPCHTNEYLPVVFSPPRHGSNCPRFDLVGRRVDISNQMS